MRIGLALTLVLAFPTVAAAQYGFQLRPSPYRILSGWEQSANARGPSIEHVMGAATPVSDHRPVGRAGIPHNGRDSDVAGGIGRKLAPHY